MSFSPTRSSATIAVIIFVILPISEVSSAFFWKRNSFCSGSYITAAFAVICGGEDEPVLEASRVDVSVAFNKVAYDVASFKLVRDGLMGRAKNSTPPRSEEHTSEL